MRLPKYIKLEPVNNGLKPSLKYKLIIAWWGVPIVYAKAMKENFTFKTFGEWASAWLCVYPKCILRMWFS